MPNNRRDKEKAPPIPMTCVYCRTTVGGYSALEAHVVREHGVKRHELYCSLCEGLTFDSLQKRRAHNRKAH